MSLSLATKVHNKNGAKRHGPAHYGHAVICFSYKPVISKKYKVNLTYVNFARRLQGQLPLSTQILGTTLGSYTKLGQDSL